MACCGGRFQGDSFQGEGFFPRCPECGYYHRDLTPAFQGLVLEACAAIVPSSRRLHRAFRIDDPKAQWSADLSTGLFTVTVPGQGRAHAEFHSVGSWDEESGAFQWSWAEDEPKRPQTTKAADHARRVGAHYWLRSLTAPQLYTGETEAWHLTMVTAHLSEHPAVTAIPTATGKAFLVLERPAWEH